MKIFLMTLSLVLSFACSLPSYAAGKDPEKLKRDKAVAVIYPTEGNKVRGVVWFEQSSNQVKVTAEIEGLTPNGYHGFHIHEYGDLTSKDGSSAGGHYNPKGHKHAGPDQAERHAGDLGNLKADTHGKARYKLTVENITIAGATNPIVGRGLIIHEKKDDLKSQPTGDAGSRIGYGVIGVAK